MKKHLTLLLVSMAFVAGCHLDTYDDYPVSSTQNPISPPTCSHYDMMKSSTQAASSTCPVPDDLSSLLRSVEVIDSDRILQLTFYKLSDGNFPNVTNITFRHWDYNGYRYKTGTCFRQTQPDNFQIQFQCKLIRAQNEFAVDKYDLDQMVLENEKCHSTATFHVAFPDACTNPKPDLPVYVQNELVSPLELSDK